MKNENIENNKTIKELKREENFRNNVRDNWNKFNGFWQQNKVWLYAIVALFCTAIIATSIDKVAKAIRENQVDVVETETEGAFVLQDGSTTNEIGISESESDLPILVEDSDLEQNPEPETETMTEPEPFTGIVVDSEDAVFSTYRNTVCKRVNSNKEFIDSEERAYYVEHGYQIEDKFIVRNGSRYYYPVVMTVLNDKTFVTYTDQYGYVMVDIYGKGYLHSETSNGLVYTCQDYMLCIVDEKLVLKTFDYTNAKLDNPGKYVGTNEINGAHYFKDGTNLYEVFVTKLVGSGSYRLFKNLVAKDVEFVVDVNYYYTSDMFACPLLQMKDGSLKCYCLESYDGGEYSKEWLHPLIYESNGNAMLEE